MNSLIDRTLFLDLNNLTINSKKITVIIDDNNEPWFKAKDIATILEYSKPNKAIWQHVNEKYKKKSENLRHSNSLKYNKNTIFINKNGIESLLIKSKKIIEDDLINDFISKLDLNLKKIIKTKEQEILSKLIKSFKNQEIILQYPIDNYRIDLYFPKYKLAIECDEHGHFNYNPEDEANREKYIKNVLNCKFIRFNPDSKDFDIFLLINEIYSEILSQYK